MSSRRTISNTFTVTTMDNPVSVQAQYSPDKTVVHTVWQAGDLYMRTRESDSSAWSAWHKIVGESGDETDFSFGISQYKTTANVTTAPSDITTWSDAPLAVTSSKPYLWAKVQKKSWNESTQQYQVDSTSYIRLTGEDGYTVQAQYAPNDNPTSSQIHTTWQDGDLYMRTKQSNETTWSAWHKIVGENGGETDYTFGISQYKTTANASTAPSDISSWSDAPLAVTDSKPYLWSKVQKKSWNESTQSYVVDSTRYIRLTGEESVVYRLTPSIKEIVKKKDGTYVPSGDTYITCGVTKNEGGTQSTPSSSEYTLKYSLNGGDETTYTSTSVKVNQITSNLVFILYVNGVVVDRETIGLITDGTDGTSPYFADLDNEMDSIACTHDGKVSSYQTVSTKISMFKGSSAEAFTVDKIYRNGTQMSWAVNNNGVWPSLSGGTVTLVFFSGAAVNIKDDFKITLYATNATSVTRELHFIVNGIRANAIYRLVPSHSQIVKKKDGTYVPSGNVTCSVEKTENGSTSTPNASEYTLEKSVNGGSYTAYSETAASSITSDLKFRLTVGGVVVDLETIPLVSDGDKGNTGDSAPVAFATPDKITIPCGISGYVSSALTQGVTFSLKVGTNAATVTGVTSGTKPTGVTVTGQADNAVTITIATTASASGLAAGVTFTVTGTYDGKTYSATITVALIGSIKGDTGATGATGPQGKIGRFFYYAGEFDSSNTTQSFVVNDAQAPYFSHGVNASTGLMNCHVYNPTENGTFTMAQMWANSSQSWNNAPWEVMTNDFKYLITQAIFGDYAHFGSSIINGDYMLSQYGYMRGFGNTKTPIADSTQYIYADPDDMFGESKWDSTHDENIIVNRYLDLEITDNDSYLKIDSISAFEIKKDRWYTMWLVGYCEGDNNTHTLTVAIGTSSSNIITASEISVKGYNYNSSIGHYDSYITFKATEDISTCYMYVKNDSLDAYGLVNSIIMRYAQFVPTLCIDMKTGKLVANNIEARGELHADSFVYSMIYGNTNGQTIRVNDESIINLGTGAVSTIVRLPSPLTSKGRRIEIFNHSTSWEITWVGANSSSLLEAAYASGLNYRTSYSMQLKYMLVYCDGTTWWCLKAE